MNQAEAAVAALKDNPQAQADMARVVLTGDDFEALKPFLPGAEIRLEPSPHLIERLVAAFPDGSKISWPIGIS